MKLFRNDLVPVLAIVAGGVLGASLSFNFLGRSQVEADPVWVVDLPMIVQSPTEPLAPSATSARRCRWATRSRR